MAVGQLTLRLHTGFLQAQLRVLAPLLEQLPKRRARRFHRKFLRLLVAGVDCQRRCLGTVAATRAGDLAFQVRVVGVDELIAAALRAQKRGG